MTIAHDRTGSGEPLVLIHGFGSFRRVWDPVLPLLEPHREVLAIDVPGFGETPPDVDHPTPPRLAERIASWFDELGLDRPHVAGFSMGGWITLELNKLGRTASACAICPAGFFTRRERAFAKASLRNSRVTLSLLDSRLEKVMASAPLRRGSYRQYMEHGDRMSPETAVATSRAFTGASGFDATLEGLHEHHFTGGEAVTPPVTVAWGDKDKLLLPRQAERARRAIPQARHVWLPGCGHVPMVDAPEIAANAILTSA